MIYSKNVQITEYEDMAVEKTIISKFHRMAEKLKLLSHNSFSITTTITVDLYNFDRCLNTHILNCEIYPGP